MAGRLGEWSVEDLLQIAKITQKTTSIEVVGEDRSGVIYLRDGGVVHAELLDRPAPAGDRFSQFVEVIVSLAALDTGTFEFGTREVPFSDERPIDVKAVFAAMEKDLAREKRVADLGISWLEGLGATRHISEPITLKPAVWQLLADLIEPFSLASLERRVGRRKAVALVLTLEAVGVLARDVEMPAPVKVPDRPVVDHPIPAVPSNGAAHVQSSTGPLISDPEAWERAGIPDVEPTPDGPPDASSQHDAPVGVGVEDGGEAHEVDSEVPNPTAGGAFEEGHTGAPIVEIFGLPAPPMHEVVTPSETTLVSDVLGDLKSRFRSGRGQTLEAGYEE